MKTWFVDIDGTIVEHRSNKEIGEGTHEKLLPGSKEFLEEARENGDQIILTTARLTIHSEHTERMLNDFGIPYDEIVYNLSPYERIVVNDIKPIGESRNYEMYTAFAINVEGIEDLMNIEDGSQDSHGASKKDSEEDWERILHEWRLNVAICIDYENE